MPGMMDTVLNLGLNDIAVEGMAKQSIHLNYQTIPNVIYTWPEIATVGSTEEELKMLQSMEARIAQSIVKTHDLDLEDLYEED